MTNIRLAVDGEELAHSALSPTWPPPDEDVRDALLSVYADGSWGKYDGPHHERLVQALTEMHRVKFAYPCCSGTFAVELALRGLKVEAGAEVVLAGYDFGGNFRAVEAVGATPVLVDIATTNCCLAAELTEAAITPQTRAILVSHLHGGIADMQQLRAIADRHGVALIEDACQTPGGVVQQRVAGAWGDVGILSFGGSKLLTAGRGGAILTNQEAVWQRAKVYCERGNHAFPFSELQAAVLLPQLAKLDHRNAQRRANVTQLLTRTDAIPALQPMIAQPADCSASYYKVAWKYDSRLCGNWTRERFVAAVQAEGVHLDVGFRGFLRRGSRSRRPESLDSARSAAEDTVLLHHPVLLESREVISLVAQAIEKVTQTATNP